MSREKHTNRLVKEFSPYLLQHAHNPVDWFPWGGEAFERAKRENKPLLLSIGYSACHWCHVMEKESFENEEIAQIMNTHFISVKVDREERPDIDSIYMQCVQMLTGQGGWPTTLFLTHDGLPFYGGTYFPPEDRQGFPGFKRVLQSIAEIYHRNPQQVQQNTQAVLKNLRGLSQLKQSQEGLSEKILEIAFRKLSQNFDYRRGGFGSAPKFPNPMVLSYLLRYYLRSKNKGCLEMVELNLKSMAEGGIYDQIGGGFHRYSVDERWLVPHFEKMLYDNALLVPVYLDAYLVTKNPSYKKIVVETLDYVIREMTGTYGEFFSTQDADSEGEEGKYYVWRSREIKSILGERDADIFCRFYGVTEAGNFEGKNILTSARTYEQIARQLETTTDKVESVIIEARRKIMEARELRIKPGRDEKALANWNGLMLSAFSRAARVLGRSDYLRIAEQNAHFVLNYLCQGERLLHACKDGQAKLNAYLDDYACIIDSFIEVYQSTFDSKWLRKASSLADVMIDLFWDEETGAFYYTAKDHEKLITRLKDFQDNAIPAGNSTAAMDLLRLAEITDREDFRSKAETIFKILHETVGKYPSGFGQLLCGLDFYFDSPREIVLVGSKDDPAIESFRRIIFDHYSPNQVVILDECKDNKIRELVPLVKGKSLIDGKPAVYVCEKFTCRRPVTTAEELESLLN